MGLPVLGSVAHPVPSAKGCPVLGSIVALFSSQPLRKQATPGSGPVGLRPVAPECEKSPFSCDGVKTVPGHVDCCAESLCPWYPTKKKKRSLPFRSLGKVIGPPKVNPYWLRFRTSRGISGCAALLKKELALKASLRRNSKPLPCHWLVPDLVTTLITPPPLRPYSAE